MGSPQDQPAREPGIPYYPVWSVVMIAVGLLVIGALIPRPEWRQWD